MGFFSRLFGAQDDNPDTSRHYDDAAEVSPTPAQDEPAQQVASGEGSKPVAPFSPERVMAILDADGDHYEVDDEGDLIGRWDDDIYQFIFYGSDRATLQIVGHSMQSVPSEHADELQVVVEDWNRDHFWPKALVRHLDSGIFPFGEVSVAYHDGATDAQLRQQILCAMGTTSRFLQSARDRFGIEPVDDETSV